MSWLRVVRAVAIVLCLTFPLSSTHAAEPFERQAVDEVMERVATLRNLPLREYVEVAVVDDAEMAQRLATSTAPGEQATLGKLWRLLGRSAASVDSPHAELQNVQLLGLYSPEEGRIEVLDTGGFDARSKLVLAHEVTHALQDQHFGLSTLVSDGENNTDRRLAAMALAEGDAVLTARIFSMLSLSEAELLELRGGEGEHAHGKDAHGSGMPLLYTLGAAFVQSLLVEGGWDAVNAAYADPPQSTEQVLHPQKYLTREAPLGVRLQDGAALLGPEWGLLREDTLGELELRLTLQRFLPLHLAWQAAAGWGGDRYQLLERADDGFLALVLATEWDSAHDAQDFFNAYSDVVMVRYGDGARSLHEQGRLRVWLTPDGVLRLEGSEQRVVLSIAPEQSHAEVLASAAS